MLNGHRTLNRKKATFFSRHYHSNISASDIGMFGYFDVINLPTDLKRPVQCIFFFGFCGIVYEFLPCIVYFT